MNKAPFSTFPRNVRTGIIFTIISWIFLILSSAILTSTVSLLQITLALVCSVVIYSLKPWSRIFCIVINLFIITNNVYVLYTLFFTHPAGTHHQLPAAVYFIDILLFATSTFFLLHRQTAAFYTGNKPSS